MVAEDLYSLIACNEAGSVELLEMLNDLDLRNLEELGKIILDRSKNAMGRRSKGLGIMMFNMQWSLTVMRNPCSFAAGWL